MNPQGPAGLPCPVCGPAVPQAGHVRCPRCGLPAAGQAALVVARIGATLTELARDRDALLTTLRAAAHGAPPAPGPAPAAPPPAPATPPPTPSWGPAPVPSWGAPAGPPPTPPTAPPLP